MTIKGVIFDMDGVLASTDEYHYQSWRRLAEDEGMTFTREDNEAIRGMTRPASFKVFMKGREVSDETAQAWMARKNQYFQGYLAQMSQADRMPGAESLLRSVQSAGLRLAVGSSSRNARPVLKSVGLLSYFEVVGDGYCVTNSKPAPDVFLWVAGALRLRPPDLLVIEDSAAGVQAALTGGFRVVAVGDAPGIEAAHHVTPSLENVSLEDLLAMIDDPLPAVEPLDTDS